MELLLKQKAETTGYLEVILGPMFSGKTTELMRIYNRYKECDISCVVINHTNDKSRWKDTTEMATHNGIRCPCIYIQTLKESLQIVDKYDIFLINEGQLFEDIYDIVNILVNMHKKRLYVCGLDGDFKRRKFGKILDIVPLSDEVRKLKAICKKCKKRDAIFTHRLNAKINNQIVIGDCNMYTSYCRSCYNMVNCVSPVSTAI